MGIFDRFPYSSTHEMNLDFMLGKATEIAEDMQQVTAGMEQVQAGLSAISEKTEQATQAAAQAAQSASSIEGSVTAAEEAAEEAQMHNESAQTWANNAMTYKADCQRSATEAAASSSSAAQAATAAAGSEDTVAQYAQAANASAQSAANNNDSAHQYANQASASASNATFHSSNAQTAATNANTSATNAETAATNAQTAATRTAALKDDCETLHRMCAAAVDQAATEAVNAANSAAQAAATKTDVENLVESLPEDFTDLNNTVNQLSDEIDDQRNTINSILSFEPVNIISGYKQGYCINVSGAEVTNTAFWYGTAEITSDLVGKEFTISGSAWYEIKPYVFVGSGNPIVPDIPSVGSTLTQYTDLKFVPTETGTLYVNKYDSGATHHTGTAIYQNISSIKSDLMPEPLPVKDITEYEPVSLTMLEGKLLYASTGVVTDSSETSYQVSDYVEVTPSSKIMVSTSHFYEKGLYAFYDKNQNYISGLDAAPGGTVTNIRCKIVDVPSTAKYVRIGYYYQQYAFPECALWKGVVASALPSAKWVREKWAVIGDSLTASYGVTNIHYWEYIKCATGITVENLGESGMGYAKGTNNFMAKSLLVPNDSTVVTIFGSGNDGSSGLDIGTWSDTGTETIAGCINTTIDNVFGINPIIPLGIITPSPWVNNMPSNNGFMERYANLIVEICNKRSIPCLDLYHCSNLNPNNPAVREAAYSKDSSGGVHPNEKGQLLLATHIKAFLETLLM